MNQQLGHLIVVSHRAGQVWQIHFSRAAIKILIAALFLSFALVVLFGYTFPPLVSDSEHAQLEAENRALRIETKNLALKMAKLAGQISSLEAQSGRIAHHLEAD